MPLRNLKGDRDPRPLLPPHCKLLADGERDGRKRARVTVFQWDARVNEAAATRGLEALARTMYGGDRGRIQIPPDLLVRVAGQNP